MQKKLIINVRPIISCFYEVWDGKKTFKQFIRKNKQQIFDNVDNYIYDVPLPDLSFDAKYKLNVDDKEMTIIFIWTEEENINIWNEGMKKYLLTLSDHLNKLGLFTYVT